VNENSHGWKRFSSLYLNIWTSMETKVKIADSQLTPKGPLLHQVVIDLLHLKNWLSVAVDSSVPCVLARRSEEEPMQVIVPVWASSVTSVEK
jgi:hypothetical protein